MMYDIFTPAEAAKRLGVTRQNIYNLIKDGTLKATNVGCGTYSPRWRIKEEDLATITYTKYKVRHDKIIKTEIIEIVEEPELDTKAELSKLKNDLLEILCRIEDLEQKL